jgi:hypothetical protein
MTLFVGWWPCPTPRPAYLGILRNENAYVGVSSFVTVRARLSTCNPMLVRPDSDHMGRSNLGNGSFFAHMDNMLD